LGSTWSVAIEDPIAGRLAGWCGIAGPARLSRETEEGSVNMPLVTVEFLPGRSREAKEKLVKAITDAMVEIGGGTREHCWVIIRETSA
jgi:4-oxalocrotonate tautomerase family enzyme